MVRVELAPLADAALVADAIAVAVDAAHRSRSGSALRAATDALGEQRALLVLDNFEHLGRRPTTWRRCWMRARA